MARICVYVHMDWRGWLPKRRGLLRPGLIRGEPLRVGIDDREAAVLRAPVVVEVPRGRVVQGVYAAGAPVVAIVVHDGAGVVGAEADGAGLGRPGRELVPQPEHVAELVAEYVGQVPVVPRRKRQRVHEQLLPRPQQLPGEEGARECLLVAAGAVDGAVRELEHGLLVGRDGHELVPQTAPVPPLGGLLERGHRVLHVHREGEAARIHGELDSRAPRPAVDLVVIPHLDLLRGSRAEFLGPAEGSLVTRGIYVEAGGPSERGFDGLEVVERGGNVLPRRGLQVVEVEFLMLVIGVLVLFITRVGLGQKTIAI